MVHRVHELYWKLVCGVNAVLVPVTAHFVFCECKQDSPKIHTEM